MEIKEIFNARNCVHRLFRGPNRVSDLYEVDGDFFYCRSREEAERELKEAGFELIRQHGMRKCYAGLARRIEC